MARRIVVYGVTGSGKSMLAARIATATGLPYHCVDDLTWLPGWVEVPAAEQRRRMAAIAAEPDWVLDAIYSAWADTVLPHVELIVALDYPRWLSLSRLLRRTLRRMVDRRPICNSNVESARNAFSRNSMIVWHFRSFPHKRARIRRWLGEGRPVLRFTRPRDVERWVTGLPGSAHRRP